VALERPRPCGPGQDVLQGAARVDRRLDPARDGDEAGALRDAAREAVVAEEDDVAFEPAGARAQDVYGVPRLADDGARGASVEEEAAPVRLALAPEGDERVQRPAVDSRTAATAE